MRILKGFSQVGVTPVEGSGTDGALALLLGRAVSEEAPSGAAAGGRHMRGQ
jgi:hypothetical protein